MSRIILSKRLTTVAKYIIKGTTVADIGSDHAYLPCYLIENNLVTFAIAGEVADGPYKSALKKVTEFKYNDKISVRKGDGLQVIEQGEVDCITIAGMGGPLIVNILEGGKAKLSDVKRLILQPNVGAHLIRKWLINNNWELIAEEIIEENDKIYEVLVAEKGNPLKPYNKNNESEVFLGPFLKAERNGVFIKKWQGELQKLEIVLKQLRNASNSEQITAKRKNIEQKVKIIKEVL